MLFNSYFFIFVFLPATVVGFYLLGRMRAIYATGFLTLASLFFYAWWNPVYVALLLASIVFNYLAGAAIARAVGAADRSTACACLTGAITANLLMLGYFKYTNFLLATVSGLTSASLGVAEIVLPLGISFYTFTQIAFLVDAYRSEAKEYNFVHYALFVTYFPHLIAGPVLHHKEMIPQFAQAGAYRIDYEKIAAGLTIFAMGLFKKVVLADGIAVYVRPVFDAAANGIGPSLLESWGGALSYTLQLYFDFSGYSDMAIGLSLLFGVRLPLNFNSPYKARNIIEFWRCWHMTLSRFLRDYLYIPLGGSKKGVPRRYVNLMATMLLGGLWHGAGWTFVIWGGLHGIYLVINHGWRALMQRLNWKHLQERQPYRIFSWTLTFLAVVVAWVFFRAESMYSAWSVLKGMIGLNGVVLPERFLPKLGAVGQRLADMGVGFAKQVSFTGSEFVWIAGLLLVVFLMPNTQQIMARCKPVLTSVSESEPGSVVRLSWKLTALTAVVLAAIAFAGIAGITKASEFLYFQF